LVHFFVFSDDLEKAAEKLSSFGAGLQAQKLDADFEL
jgi:hypothetical protein